MSELSQRASRHAALSDVMRLAVVDELSLGDKSPGELQAALDLPSNLMAHHLKVLEAAAIVTRRRSEGDRRRTYLTLSDRSVIEVPTTAIRADRVLFVCTANSARSQLAAALWARAADVPVTSAGTQPAERVADGARKVADRHDLRLPAASPRLFADALRNDDLVVAVCDNAYEELGDVIDLHWSIPDPVRTGSDAAFDDAYQELSHRISSLAPSVVAS
jgi:protein-tyrosine-phosphatase